MIPCATACVPAQNRHSDIELDSRNKYETLNSREEANRIKDTCTINVCEFKISQMGADILESSVRLGPLPVSRLRLCVVKALNEAQRTSGSGWVIEMVSYFSFRNFNDQYLSTVTPTWRLVDSLRRHRSTPTTRPTV